MRMPAPPRAVARRASSPLATYGVGMLIGTFLSGAVVEHYTTAAGPDWQRIWLFPAGVALVVLVAFLLLFRDRPALAAAPTTH